MSFGIGKTAGVAILVSPKFSGKIIRYVHDTDGRILSLIVDLNSFKFNIICVYAPNNVSDRKLFFKFVIMLKRMSIKVHSNTRSH